MLRTVGISASIGFTLCILGFSAARAECDDRYPFLCAAELAAAASAESQNSSDAKPVKKPRRTWRRGPLVITAVPPSAWQVTSSKNLNDASIASLAQDNAAAEQASSILPVPALQFTLQLAPNMVQKVRPASSACMVEQVFNDLTASLAPPEAQAQKNSDAQGQFPTAKLAASEILNFIGSAPLKHN